MSTTRTSWAVAFTFIMGMVHIVPAGAVDCGGLPPSLQVDLDSIRVFQFTGGANCWGWIAPDGTEYAIMGGRQSVGFVNLATMTVSDTVPVQTCSWRELKTYRHYCYAVSECTGLNQGMVIIDMQYLPDSVHLVGTYTSGSNVRSHCISIDTARGYCYLVRQNYSGYRIVSLANPEAPVDVGTGVNTPDMHDMTAFNDTVWAAEGNNHSFSIWNCTNKIAPVMLARVTIPSGGYVHNLWPTADRKYLASTEETADHTMKIWNTSNLSNISQVGAYLGPSGLAHNAHIEGNYLFLSHYESGISILDITAPECKEEKVVFDTYLTGNNPNFNGCWGVFPHNIARNGYVYASNIDGRFFIFQMSVEVAARFSASPRIGHAPLAVQFDDLSPTSPSPPTGWLWEFGDGDFSPAQNPAHVYPPGVYDVRLEVTGRSGTDDTVAVQYITALAETVTVRDTVLDPGMASWWEIRMKNNVPVSELRLPVTLSNIPTIATFDSISMVGCRTDYFEYSQVLYDARSTGVLVLQMKANHGGGSPPLPPGEGPIARVHLTIATDARAGRTINLSWPPIGSLTLDAKTLTASFMPDAQTGKATISGIPCNCDCHGDPVCDSAADVLDVVATVEEAFRNGSPTVDADCPHSSRTDLDCNGATDVLDVVGAVGMAFRGLDPAAIICDPCAALR